MASLLEGRSYEEVEQSLKDFPMTWYPALLATLVEAGYEKKCFNVGGASRMIEKVEKRLGKVGKRCGININFKEGEEDNITVLLGPLNMPACEAVKMVQEVLDAAKEDAGGEVNEGDLVWSTLAPAFEALGFTFIDDWDKAVI